MFGGRGSLRDVVRHEYAHALEHHYPRLTGRSARFRETFGEGDNEDFVSDYAKTNPSEDFAETFMLYIRHAGRLPIKLNTTVIRQKWRFVADLARVVSSGGARW